MVRVIGARVAEGQNVLAAMAEAKPDFGQPTP